LHRREPDPATLWHEVAPLVERGRGILVMDDTMPDNLYVRKMKQECGVERAMVRAGRAQRNYIGRAIRAFVRLERRRLRTEIGWNLAMEALTRASLRRYLAHPWYTLPAPLLNQASNRSMLP
jgi:hypothetical protein